MLQAQQQRCQPARRGPERATPPATASALGLAGTIVHNIEADLHTIARTATDQDIHDRIFGAILARRLHPGARLGEEELARLFGVSRTKVRQALAKLAQDGVVQVRRNHGASVAAPTRAQARQVMEFRGLVEPTLVSALARNCPPGAVDVLRQHVAAEQDARAMRDDGRLVRLTGEFHLRLADLHGNALMARTLREAEALTCLSILSYGRPAAAACLPDEHGRILAAIEAGDGDEAARLMRHHLQHVEAEMDLDEPPGVALAGAPTFKLAAALDVFARSAA